MEGRTHRSMTLAQLATALIILSSGFRCASSKKVEVTYYLHDNAVPPDVTFVKVASASGNISSNAPAFGDINVSDAILRAGISNDSALIGSASGQVVALRNGLSFITLVHDVTVPHYSGSLTASARFNISAPSWEIGISAGTGSFRGARGYYTVSVADPNPLAFIIKYNATIFIPKL